MLAFVRLVLFPFSFLGGVGGGALCVRVRMWLILCAGVCVQASHVIREAMERIGDDDFDVDDLL